MILAEKIVELRKKNGWSQEELAEMGTNFALKEISFMQEPERER